MRRKLLAAVAVLATLLVVGTLVDSVRRAREAARVSQCVCTLKMMGLGLINYESQFQSFPPGTVPNHELPLEGRLSWAVAAWSFVGDGQIHLNVDLSKAWDDPVNRPPTGYSGVGGSDPTFELFLGGCREHPATRSQGYSSLLQYPGIAGLGPDAATLPVRHERAGVFGYDRVTRMTDITDGAANTMMLVESGRGDAPWTAGLASIRPVDPARKPYIGLNRPFGGLHREGANVLMADGSVRFFKKTIDPQVFESLSTIAGVQSDGGSY